MLACTDELIPQLSSCTPLLQPFPHLCEHDSIDARRTSKKHYSLKVNGDYLAGSHCQRQTRDLVLCNVLLQRNHQHELLCYGKHSGCSFSFCSLVCLARQLAALIAGLQACLHQALGKPDAPQILAVPTSP